MNSKYGNFSNPVRLCPWPPFPWSGIFPETKIDISLDQDSNLI